MRRINLRPWKRPPWRRRRKGALFAPITSFDVNEVPDGTAADSCWADLGLGIDTIVGVDRSIASPILYNLSQGIQAASITDAGAVARPVNEQWTVRRIVGQVGLAMIDDRGNASDGLGSINLYWAIIKMETPRDTNPNSDVDLPFLYQNWEALKGYVSGPHRLTLAAATPSGLGSSGISTASENFGLPAVVNIKVNLRTRVRIKTEEALCFVLVVPGTNGGDDGDFEIGFSPKLKAYYTKST